MVMIVRSVRPDDLPRLEEVELLARKDDRYCGLPDAQPTDFGSVTWRHVFNVVEDDEGALQGFIIIWPVAREAARCEAFAADFSHAKISELVRALIRKTAKDLIAVGHTHATTDIPTVRNGGRVFAQQITSGSMRGTTLTVELEALARL